MGAARQGLGNPVMGEASEACMLVRRQDEQLRGVGCQLLEEGASCIVCDGADAVDLDAQFRDISFELPSSKIPQRARSGRMRGKSSKFFRSIVGSTCIIVNFPCARMVSLTAWANAAESAAEKSVG